MSYTVLARRYRSSTFDDLIGQGHVAQTLKKAITSGRIAHAYLFCGTRGTGKTSSARILAKCLNCESSDKPTPTPCGTCNSCVAIARGDDIDVIEIDAASNTGVDNIREVIENSQYRPARARFKIYIIDEAHMLSKPAFNALLKTLEEPPGHVKFILATTEPEKLLPTILSRCQRYDFRNIPTREIAGHLKSICEKEGIAADDDALLLVAKAGAGSMRDSLSLLDRLLSVGERELTADQIEQLLGLPKSQLLFDLADAVGRGDVKATLGQADAMITNGLSPDSLIASLVDHLRNLLILNTCGPDSGLVEVPGMPLKNLVAQAGQFDAVALSQDVAILEELRRQMRTSQAGRALLDATLVRLALSEQFASISDLLNGRGGSNGQAVPPAQKKNAEPVTPTRAAPRPQSFASIDDPPPAVRQAPVSETSGADPQGERRPPPDATPRLAAQAPAPASAAVVADAPAAVAPSIAAPAPVPTALTASSLDDIDVGDDLPGVGKVWEGPSMSLGAAFKSANNAAPAPRRPAEPSNVEAVDVGDLPAKWQALLAIIAKAGPSLQGLLSAGRLVQVDDATNQAVVQFSPAHEISVKLLDRNGKKEQVTAALTEVFGRPTGVRFEVAPDAATTTTAPTAPRPAQQRAPDLAAPAAPSPPPPPVPQSEPGIRLTTELKEQLKTDPLVRAALETFGGEIVKVE